MTSPAPSYHGYRFPPEIISHAVWLYHRFCLSFRDTEDLLLLRIHGEPGGGIEPPTRRLRVIGTLSTALASVLSRRNCS